MLLGNRTVTVVNHWMENGESVYVCHQMGGCSWYTQENRTLDTPGQKPAAVHRIRIPYDLNGANYADPAAWKALPSALRRDRWTLGQDAILVLGTVTSMTDEEFRQLRRSGGTASFLSWHDNTRGVHPHWYVEGS